MASTAAKRTSTAAPCQHCRASRKPTLSQSVKQQHWPCCSSSSHPTVISQLAPCSATSQVQCAVGPAAAQQPQHFAVPAGLLCTPGVTDPQALPAYWKHQTRPRLEALWSSIQRSNNAGRVLLALDELLMQLRSSRSLAVHIQQQHEDPSWAAAAAEVAVDCRKYERYVLGSKTLANKLRALHQRLQQFAQSDSSTSPGAQQQQQQGTKHPLHAQQLLQLCGILLSSVTDQLPQDSLSWLAALEQPDTNAELLKQLQQQEQDMIAAIDAVVSEPVLVQLPQPLDQLLQQDHDTKPNSVDVNPAQQLTSASDAASDMPATSSDGDHSSSGASSHVLPVTRSLLAQLMQRCSNTSVRQQVYLEVLQPKLEEATALLNKLARCRQQQAQLTGHSTYLELTQQRIAVDSSSSTSNPAQHGSIEAPAESATGACNDCSSSSPVDLLLQLAAALQPLAHEEISLMVHQQQPTRALQPGINAPEQHSNSLLQQHVADELGHNHIQEKQQFTCDPWDWDYLLHQAQQRHLKPLNGQDLQDYLRLESIVAGFSDVLQQLLGVQLVLRPTDPVEVWGAQVQAIMVMRRPTPGTTGSQGRQQQQQGHALRQHWQLTADGTELDFLGTIYLDVGGGYGCRMLRYTRSHASSSNSDTGAPNAANRLQEQWSAGPAVAIGISGTRLSTLPNRLHADHQQQAVVHQRLLQEQQEADECGPQQGSATCSSSSTADVTGSTTLTLAQLWEFGHEMGHALHLVLSSRQPACHLSGRFIPPSLLEVPSQLMERLLTQPQVLSQLCRHHQTQQPLPPEQATALAAYHGCRYNSALAILNKVAAGVAEQMYGHFGGDGEDYWRGSWEAVSGLPGAVASYGCLKELSLMPVMAAHPGTYHCYLTSWLIAAKLYEVIFQPLASERPLQQHLAVNVFEDLSVTSWADTLKHLARDFSGEADGQSRQTSSLYDMLLPQGNLDAQAVRTWGWSSKRDEG